MPLRRKKMSCWLVCCEDLDGLTETDSWILVIFWGFLIIMGDSCMKNLLFNGRVDCLEILDQFENLTIIKKYIEIERHFLSY